MNKLLLSSLLLLAISQSLSFPVDFVSLENTERSMISRFRNWHPYVEYNRDLMKIAQEEAMRMAKLGKLEMPDFNFGKDKYYTGHCYRVLSYDVDLTNSNFMWNAEKMCFSNLQNSIQDNAVYKFHQICDDLGIIYEKYYAVGFGIAHDMQQGVGYVVRIYLTNQEFVGKSNITVKEY